MTQATSPRPPASPLFRMLIDIGPLAVFFLVNALAPSSLEIGRLFAATAAFMVAMAVAMALSYWKTRHISPMLWVSGALVLVFGGLTLYFHDETFIQIKPTIVYSMFAIILAFGVITGRPLLQSLLETAYPGLSEKGWRMLTINWALFFFAMALLNEFVRWRFSWDVWVTFKLWGAIPLTFLFAMANIPMLMKHGLKIAEDAPIPPEG